MLRHISTTTFIGGIVLVAGIYYVAVAAIYYRHEIGRWTKGRQERKTAEQPEIDQFSKDKV